MPEDSSKQDEIRALAGARALPPLLLVLYHYHEAHGYQNVRWFDVFVAKGYLWVEFFFALSGFILVHVYAARGEFRYGTFLKARLARLYPLHLVTLLLMLGMVVFFRWLAAIGGYTSIYDLPGYHPYTSFWSFIGNLFLVQAWHLFPRLSWNGVSWFVSVEWFLCLLFPLYLWIARWRAWAGVALIVFGFALLRFLIQPRIGLDITFDWGIARGIGDFSIGVGLAMLYRAIKTRADKLSQHWLSLAQLLSLAALFCAIYNTGWSHTVRDYWVLPPLMAIIFALSFDRGIGARVFQSAPLRLLGEWSFAVYMGQTTFLQLLRVAEQRLYPTPVPEWSHAIHLIEPTVLLIVCLAWGALLYYAVERPANAWLRTHWR
ncbi:MAG: acyltransferase [Alphaproteobacteria bacterium]|nr:acyltransferase [Alphaproteobacteria bacterium]MBV9061583.1 acyltransferase [Alphaproteobacteria bacterium]